MTIQTYPSTPVPSYSFDWKGEYKTLVSEFDAGNEQRRSLRRFGKRTFSLNYKNVLTDTEWYLIENFFRQMQGAGISFWFVDFVQRKLVDEYVGRGDGATATFDLHGVTVTSGDANLKVYVNGTLKSVAGGDYVFVSGGGGAGADRITIQAGRIPAVGALITSDLIANLRIKARFPDDFGHSLKFVKVGDIATITLREVQW